MQLISLAAVPNQSFSMRLDNKLFNMTIKEANGIMVFDLSRDNEILLTGFRLLPLVLLIPYPYLQNGNFLLITENEEYPYYTQFGITQRLVFATQAEIEAILNGA